MKTHKEQHEINKSFQHLRFSVCGKYGPKDGLYSIEWKKHLTDENAKVNCHNCLRRLGIPYDKR